MTNQTKLIPMFELLLEPFYYQYMQKAMISSMVVGVVCAFLSCYLMLKGWSLIGDALAHSVVPGVSIAYINNFAYSIGAFFTGVLASMAILWIKYITHLRENTVIGFIFTTFFAIGLFLISLYPSSVAIQSIIMGNILTISDADLIQLLIIAIFSTVVLFFIWKDLLLVFFDETQARASGLSPLKYKVIFFSLLSACIVAALQTVGAILVIAMVITPGATAYLLSDKFKTIIKISIAISTTTNFLGVYLSYFLNGATGATIVLMQTLLFIVVFLFAPKHGYLRNTQPC